MTPSVYVMVDTSAGTNVVTLNGKPRDKFRVKGNTTTANNEVGHTVVHYDPGFAFDELQIGVCSSSDVSTKYKIRVFVDMFEGDGILFVPQQPVSGAILYTPSLATIEDYTFTLGGLGKNENLLAYDPIQKAVVYTGSADLQQLVAGETFELMAVHKQEGSMSAPPGCLDVFRFVQLLKAGDPREITWESGGQYTVDNLKEYAPYGEVRSARRLRRQAPDCASIDAYVKSCTYDCAASPPLDRPACRQTCAAQKAVCEGTAPGVTAIPGLDCGKIDSQISDCRGACALEGVDQRPVCRQACDAAGKASKLVCGIPFGSEDAVTTASASSGTGVAITNGAGDPATAAPAGAFLAAKKGQIVVNVTAIGTQQFVPVRYKITAGNPSNAFAVAEDGVVTIVDPEPLDADDKATQTIKLEIRAYNAANDFSKPSATVRIRLVPVNERPVFDPVFDINVAKNEFSVPVVNIGGLPAASLTCTSGNSKFSAALKEDGSACDVFSLATIAETHDVELSLSYNNILQDSKKLVVSVPSVDSDAAKADEGDDDSGMGAGAVAGIVIGLLLLLLCAVVLVLFLMKRKKEDDPPPRSARARAVAKGPADSLDNPMYDVNDIVVNSMMSEGPGVSNPMYASADGQPAPGEALYATASAEGLRGGTINNGSYLGITPNADARDNAIYDLSSNGGGGSAPGVNNPMYGSGQDQEAMYDTANNGEAMYDMAAVNSEHTAPIVIPDSYSKNYSSERGQAGPPKPKSKSYHSAVEFTQHQKTGTMDSMTLSHADMAMYDVAQGAEDYGQNIDEEMYDNANPGLPPVSSQPRDRTSTVWNEDTQPEATYDMADGVQQQSPYDMASVHQAQQSPYDMGGAANTQQSPYDVGGTAYNALVQQTGVYDMADSNTQRQPAIYDAATQPQEAT